MSRYQKGKTNLDLLERDSEWQWHQLSHMQICTLTQTHNNAGISPLSFLEAECPSCRPANSVEALKANSLHKSASEFQIKMVRLQENVTKLNMQ